MALRRPAGDSRRPQLWGCFRFALALLTLTAGQLGAAPSQEPGATIGEAGDVVETEEYRAGLIAVKARDHEAALEQWQKLLEANPASGIVLLRLAESHRALGNSAAAEAALKRILDADPENVAVAFMLAHAYMRTEREDDADQLFSEVLARYPGDASIHVGIGDTYLKEQRYEPALAAYLQALTIDPELAVAQKQVGLAHIQGRDLGAAAVAFQRYLVLEPADSDDAEIVRRLLEALEAQQVSEQ